MFLQFNYNWHHLKLLEKTILSLTKCTKAIMYKQQWSRLHNALFVYISWQDDLTWFYILTLIITGH